MKHITTVAYALLLSLIFSFTASAGDAPAAKASTPGLQTEEKSASNAKGNAALSMKVSKLTATVEAIDMATPTVTLTGAKGKSVVFEAGEEVGNLDQLKVGDKVVVEYFDGIKNIWAVVIGVNRYSKVRPLKYAVNDARVFYDHLVQFSQIPRENVTLLLDQDVTLTRMRSILGTQIKNKAGKDDMVIIFFAGHGATEKDVQSPDGDGLEKYLLPCDADPKDLYAT